MPTKFKFGAHPWDPNWEPDPATDDSFDPGYSGGGWWGSKGPAPRWQSGRAYPSEPKGSVTLDGSADVARRDEAAIEQQTVAEIPAPKPAAEDHTLWWVVGGVGVVAALGLTVAIVASKPKRRRRTRRRRR